MDDVEDAVTCEVGERRAPRLTYAGEDAPARRFSRRSEEQHIDGAGIRCGHDQIGRAVTVDVPGAEIEWAGADRYLARRVEPSGLPAIDEQDDGVPSGVGRGDVEPSVAIQIDAHRVACAGQRRIRGRREGGVLRVSDAQTQGQGGHDQADAPRSAHVRLPFRSGRC